MPNKVDTRKVNQFNRRFSFHEPFDFVLLCDPARLFWEPVKGRPRHQSPLYRMILNPAKSGVPIEAVLGLLDELFGGRDGLFVRQFDLCLDDPHSVEHWAKRVLIRNARRHRWFRTSLYFGGWRSRFLFVIYDKATELLRHGVIHRGALTRLEIRYHLKTRELPLTTFLKGRVPMFEPVLIHDFNRLRADGAAMGLRWHLQHNRSLVEAVKKLGPSKSKSPKRRLLDVEMTEEIHERVRTRLLSYLVVPAMHEKGVNSANGNDDC